MTTEADGQNLTFKGVTPVGSAVMLAATILGLWWIWGPLSAAIDRGEPEWLLSPRAFVGLGFVAFGLWSTTRHPRWIQIDPAQRRITAWTGLMGRWSLRTFDVKPGDRAVVRTWSRLSRSGVNILFDVVLEGEARSEVVFRWPERKLSREVAAALGDALGLEVTDETETKPSS